MPEQRIYILKNMGLKNENNRKDIRRFSFIATSVPQLSRNGFRFNIRHWFLLDFS